MNDIICEKCGASGWAQYSEDWDQVLCNACVNKLEDSLEDYEEKRRRKIAEDNEY